MRVYTTRFILDLGLVQPNEHRHRTRRGRDRNVRPRVVPRLVSPPVIGIVMLFMFWLRTQSYDRFVTEDGTPCPGGRRLVVSLADDQLDGGKLSAHDAVRGLDGVPVRKLRRPVRDAVRPAHRHRRDDRRTRRSVAANPLYGLAALDSGHGRARRDPGLLRGSATRRHARRHRLRPHPRTREGAVPLPIDGRPSSTTTSARSCSWRSRSSR